jgi:hypothetical protein
MTDAEALALKQGDTVIAEFGRRWFPAIVSRVVVWDFGTIVQVRVWVRKPGKTKGNARYGSFKREPDQLRHAPEPVAANVYADFLEENGHPEAAALLRKSFPLADGRPG